MKASNVPLGLSSSLDRSPLIFLKAKMNALYEEGVNADRPALSWLQC